MSRRERLHEGTREPTSRRTGWKRSSVFLYGRRRCVQIPHPSYLQPDPGFRTGETKSEKKSVIFLFGRVYIVVIGCFMI